MLPSFGFEISLAVRRGNRLNPPAPEAGRSSVLAELPLPPASPTVGGYRGDNLGGDPAVVLGAVAIAIANDVVGSAASNPAQARFDFPRPSVHRRPVKGGRKLFCRLPTGFNEFCCSGTPRSHKKRKESERNRSRR